MPFSDTTCHEHLQEAIRGRSICMTDPTFLDCGTGCGLTARTIKHADDTAKITGLEIYAPYVTDEKLQAMQRHQWGLWHHLYDSMVIGPLADFRTYLRSLRDLSFDFVVFGDSFEHVPQTDAVLALEQAKCIARKSIFMTIPCKWTDEDGRMFFVPQGEVYGNKHEKHHAHYTQEDIEALGMTFVGRGDLAFCFVWDR